MWQAALFSRTIIANSNFGYIFTTDYTDFTDFRRRGDDGQVQNNPNGRSRQGSKNPFNPCNPLWKNTSETLVKLTRVEIVLINFIMNPH